MGQNNNIGFDFDTWSEIAKNDPKAFEHMRLEAIEAFINSVPEERRDRLRRLQWRIDQERRLARTPLGACVRLSRMMWESVLGAGGLRERLLQLGASPDALESVAISPMQSAEVVPFARQPELTRRSV